MTSDRIKNRILKRALTMWGYTGLDSEHAFDPIVNLLLSSCAFELEKLYFEQENALTNILEKILETLFPEDITSVVPSHTIIQLTPCDKEAQISSYHSFKAIKRFQNPYAPSQIQEKEIHFSPSLPIKINKAQVKYLAYGNCIMHQENFFFREKIANATQSLPNGEMWVGIDISAVENLKDICFYVDINNSFQQELFFHYLKQVKVYHNSVLYQLKEGFPEDIQQVDYHKIITENYHSLHSICNEVNEFYFPNFFTLQGEIPLLTSFENELFRFFPNSDIKNEKDILWLQFKFYEIISSEIFENVRIALNCIPCINIVNHQFITRLKETLNIIPIIGKGYFLDLDYVSDDFGNRYDTKNELNNINVVVRKNGVSRIDEHSALEQLENLLGLIKDEAAAFRSIGGDFAQEELKQIQQNLASIYQEIQQKNLKPKTTPFVIISATDSAQMDMNCTISFWSTEAEEGNEIKSGTFLQEVLPSGISQALLLKTSVGGRKQQSFQDKITTYRNALLTKGRIVTISDIKAFAKNHFKETITDVEIHKGTKKEISTKSGFRRTIDIHIILNEEIIKKLPEEEWAFLKNSFLIKLENKSSNAYPYQIFEK